MQFSHILMFRSATQFIMFLMQCEQHYFLDCVNEQNQPISDLWSYWGFETKHVLQLLTTLFTFVRDSFMIYIRIRIRCGSTVKKSLINS